MQVKSKAKVQLKIKGGSDAAKYKTRKFYTNLLPFKKNLTGLLIIYTAFVYKVGWCLVQREKLITPLKVL